MSGQATLALTNDTIETRISFGTEHNVTILDTAGQLVCNSNKKSCYIECSSHNLFENVSFTVLEKLELTIINVENTTIDFNISKQDFNQLHNSFIRNALIMITWWFSGHNIFLLSIIVVNQTSCSCTVVDCLPDEISKLLTRKERQMNIPKDMRNILNIKQMCKEVIFHEAVLDTYIR